MQCVSLSSNERDDVELKTRDHSSSSARYTECVVRLTASQFGRAVKTRHASKLVYDMVYNHPPAGLTALQIGREREPQAAPKYVQRQRGDSVLVKVEKRGLFVHTSAG